MSQQDKPKWEEYAYKCSTCGRKVHDMQSVFQCEACLAPLCKDDYHFGLCKRHFDVLSHDDQRAMMEASEHSPRDLRARARSILARHEPLSSSKPWEQPARKHEVNDLDVAIKPLPEAPGITGQRCSTCGTQLLQRQVKYCRQCLAFTCKQCLKGGLLCPSHHARLPSDAQGLLERNVRRRRPLLAISLSGIAMFAVGFVTAIIGTKRGGPMPPHTPIMLAISISSVGIAMLFALVIDEQDKRTLLTLKRHGIRIRYAEQEGARYTCEACREKTPALTGGRAPRPYRCKICGKILCTNCYKEPGFCPTHDAMVSEKDRQAFFKIKQEEKLLIVIICLVGCIAICSLIVGVFMGTFEFAKVPMYCFIGMIPVAFVIAYVQSRKEKRAGEQMRMGRGAI